MANFELASRAKLRFETQRGALTAEDLWDLPLTSATGKVNLDEIALSLHKQLKTTSDVVSFVDESATADPTIVLRFEIVKHVIATKKAENAAALAARDKAETKQKLLAALHRKREGALETMSEEELLNRLNSL